MRKTLVTLVLSVSFAAQASAHEVCGKRKDIIENLGKEYGETVRFEGITKEGNFLEILYSDKGLSYTALLTEPSGRTCVLGAGTGNIIKNRDWAPTLEH